MADEISRKVKIDVDVSEALTGLKAVTREAREATKALRELEAAKQGSPDVDVANVVSNLYPITYEDASAILEGVEMGRTDRILRSLHYTPFTIKTGSGYGASGSTSQSITEDIRRSYE